MAVILSFALGLMVGALIATVALTAAAVASRGARAEERRLLELRSKPPLSSAFRCTEHENCWRYGAGIHSNGPKWIESNEDLARLGRL